MYRYRRPLKSKLVLAVAGWPGGRAPRADLNPPLFFFISLRPAGALTLEVGRLNAGKLQWTRSPLCACGPSPRPKTHHPTSARLRSHPATRYSSSPMQERDRMRPFKVIGKPSLKGPKPTGQGAKNLRTKARDGDLRLGLWNSAWACSAASAR